MDMLSVTGFPSGSAVKNIPAVQETQETWVPSLGWVDPLEWKMATHSSVFAWEIPWTEELEGLWSTGSQRVGYDWVDTHTHTHAELYGGGVFNRPNVVCKKHAGET